jgi:hypothetical protein
MMGGDLVEDAFGVDDNRLSMMISMVILEALDEVSGVLMGLLESVHLCVVVGSLLRL